MNFSFDFPEGTLVIARDDLKDVIRELIDEIQTEEQCDEVLKIKEAADLLKVSVPTVRSLIERGDIPHFKRGQVIRFRRTDILEWMSNDILEEVVN